MRISRICVTNHDLVTAFPVASMKKGPGRLPLADTKFTMAETGHISLPVLLMTTSAPRPELVAFGDLQVKLDHARGLIRGCPMLRHPTTTQLLG